MNRPITCCPISAFVLRYANRRRRISSQSQHTKAETKKETAAQQILSQAGKGRLISQLKSLASLQQLSERDLGALVDIGKETRLTAGSPILRDDLAPAGLTVLLEGDNVYYHIFQVVTAV